MLIALIVLICFIFIFAMAGIRIIRPYEKGVIERLEIQQNWRSRHSVCYPFI